MVAEEGREHARSASERQKDRRGPAQACERSKRNGRFSVAALEQPLRTAWKESAWSDPENGNAHGEIGAFVMEGAEKS